MLRRSEMLATFRSPSNPPLRLVGFEREVFCFHRRGHRPVDYATLCELLDRACRLLGGDVQDGAGGHRALLANGAQLFLEPGGQLEFASAPSPTLAGCIAQHALFEGLLQQLRAELGLTVFYGGATPLHTVAQIGLVVASDRYRIMDREVPGKEDAPRRVMRQVASLQVTFDYPDAERGAELLRAALYASPFVAAMLFHAPFLDGRRSGVLSARVPIWNNLDPARTGFPPGFSSAQYSFDDYLEFVLRTPMVFIETADGLVPAERLPFHRFASEGFRGRQPTLRDFTLHCSTMFPEVRARNTIEVRSIDGQDPRLVVPTIALLCGLLLTSAARRDVIELLGFVPESRFAALSAQLARTGLQGEVGGRPVRGLALELLAIARAGLRDALPDGPSGWPYLERIAELTQQGLTPADVVLQRFRHAEDWLVAGRTFDEPQPAALAAGVV